MFKLFRLTIAVTLLCFINVYCKKDADKTPDEKRGIFYREVNSTLNFNQTGSLKLDINQDGTNDFEVYKDKYNTDIDSLRGFFVKNLGENKMTLIKLTGNPLFSSMNLMSYTKGEVISELLAAEYTWDSQNGLLAMTHEPDRSFIARWSDGVAKIMAIRLSVRGKSHYGWIKLQYSRDSNSITVISYAYNQTADELIKAEQTE